MTGGAAALRPTRHFFLVLLLLLFRGELGGDPQAFLTVITLAVAVPGWVALVAGVWLVILCALAELPSEVASGDVRRVGWVRSGATALPFGLSGPGADRARPADIVAAATTTATQNSFLMASPLLRRILARAAGIDSIKATLSQFSHLYKIK
ncbi:hypothetical protein [Phenylobacterium sp.]|uniref:hypothetical protein n=1 Tax=Phenylobacterium sp. TaxID=1871053 RepID=UPI002F42C53B